MHYIWNHSIIVSFAIFFNSCSTTYTSNHFLKHDLTLTQGYFFNVLTDGTLGYLLVPGVKGKLVLLPSDLNQHGALSILPCEQNNVIDAASSVARKSLITTAKRNFLLRLDHNLFSVQRLELDCIRTMELYCIRTMDIRSNWTGLYENNGTLLYKNNGHKE